MGRLSSRLRSLDDAVGSTGIGFWCPGCDGIHVIVTEAASGPVWEWDGNVEAPTFNPSVRVRQPIRGEPKSICHFFVRAGKLDFCGDSTHNLAGQLVDIPDWPYAEGEYGGV